MNDPILREFLTKSEPLKPKIKMCRLFGSRAKGSERPDSDYDLFLVVTDDFMLSDKDKLYDIVMDILLDTGRLVSLKIFKEKEFHRLTKLQTPFMENVIRDGIQIG